MPDREEIADLLSRAAAGDTAAVATPALRGLRRHLWQRLLRRDRGQRKRWGASAADGAEENSASLAALGPRRVPLPADGRNGRRVERRELPGRARTERGKGRG